MGPDPGLPRTPAPIVETTGLTKFYGRQLGVDGVDLRIERGEVFGFLGPNGSGKTTTIRLLLDYIRPTRGSATLFGLDSHRDSVAVRGRVGYLPGELRLYQRITGRQLLHHLGRLRGRIPHDRIEELARRLDCDIDRPIRTLSSGNRQKLGLIQALMSDPELLVLDEPTIGLDPLMQQIFYELVDEARRAGQTVFLSSHVLPEVARVCDRVCFIRDGRIAGVERIADLRARAVRHVEIEFAHPVSAASFARLEGVRDVQADERRLRCTVVGSMDALVKALGRPEVLLVTSAEPSLEDVFLTYYGRNGDG